MFTNCPTCGAPARVFDDYETGMKRYKHGYETRSGAPIDCVVSNDQGRVKESELARIAREAQKQ